MKKVILIISLMILAGVLVGCNLPGQSEPTVDIVATQVAKMLTEAAIEDEVATATLSPSPTQTEPSTEDTPTLTATATETPTETHTPTIDISDPAAQLGSPAWTQDFDGNSSSWDFDYDQATFETGNGYLNLTAITSANWHSWYVSSPKLKNAYVEATILMVNGSGLDRFGLAVRSSNDGQQFYFLSITADGQWGFFRMENDVNMNDVNINEIKGYQSAEQLNDIVGTPHRVGIWMEGNAYTFYIDGEEIGSASDNTLMQKGYTGFLIAFDDTPGFTVRVDQLQYWDNP